MNPVGRVVDRICCTGSSRTSRPLDSVSTRTELTLDLDGQRTDRTDTVWQQAQQATDGRTESERAAVDADDNLGGRMQRRITPRNSTLDAIVTRGIRRSPRLTKTPEDAQMTRAKVVEVVVQTPKRATRNQPTDQNQATTAPAANPSDERGSDAQDAPPDAAASGNMLDQLSTPVANLAPSPAPTGTDTHVITAEQSQQLVTPTNPTAQQATPLTTRQAPPPAAPRIAPLATTDRQVAYQSRDGDDDEDDSDNDDDDDDDDDDDGSSSSSDGNDDSDDGREGGRCRLRRQPVTRPGDRDFHRNRRRVIRDLDLPTFLPTPQTSVTTWIACVDLALEGARQSGRGEWTDQELYYIIGNKLQYSDARWWVQLDRKLRDRETYADFAAALRDLCGNNRIRERMLLAQFYPSLDHTTRVLMKQRPKPTTLEEAVDKATEINDPIDNVAQGMEHIGQAFVIAPDTYVVRACGTTGQMALILGVGTTDVAEEEKLACFTNSCGEYNKYHGLWEAPKGRVLNGHMWAPVPRKCTAPAAAPTTAKRMATTKMAQKAKVNMVVTAGPDYYDESDDGKEADAPRAPPPLKKTVEATPTPGRFSELKCYACNQLGHFARECPDAEVRARNDEYLARREQERKRQENEDRVT
ncbi:hypothetical protein PHYSODRAFT_321522 [Phytophthora sojae]|uniref:CCHC-type domain-containing protein n=1 Tax=Phytophthora sojae (strain P6497) TaxID=1094619 RepID=G4YII4_PHYSP|nr:hypothetical protein PHYSODRAFT_321522 [Phytophthora sojae]EGZ27787.1 hypothetical protein PHYSODRAFT_321522 [Phytophthora sojae]|eukprot:XP_009515062.1 hypothetical protein PHYSODRAFT_321522 [Phytophthora sojae]